MKTSTFSKILASLVLATAIALMGVFGSSTSTAYAQQGTPMPGGPRATAGAKLAEFNKEMYDRAQSVLKSLQQIIDKANQAANKTQEWIDEVKAKGVNTSEAEAALATFKTQIAAAQASYDSAKATLDAHAGFDNNGNVTDRELARQTILAVGKSVRDARQTLTKATVDFQKTMRDLLKKYRENRTATPKP
ncbi:MAG: hypothetical protein HZC38_11125 [Chloroflexi bacterium]|nr:hypothetical protein [Chloroflexota bacterium]MBI5082871.1 hypothetical protein [Chloroflexota bacterium]MBI5713955.1 hypothetical protein [Chloroflexota bacterium]